MKDSGIEWIGQIPESWKLERLQWHLDEINEKNNPVKTTNILSLTNKLGVVPYSEKGNQGNNAKENYDEYKVAYPDTIVANSMNILIGSVGYCKFYGCVSPVYYVYKVKKNNNIKFWSYVFQTEQFQKELRKYANGILEIRLRVSSDDILKRLVAVPSYEEQIKIADILDKKCSQIDELISIQEKEIEKLKEYKTIICKEILDNHELFDYVPQKRKFKALATLCNGKEIEHEGGDIPVYGSGGIFKYTDKELMNGESLLMGRKGTIDKPILVNCKFWSVDTMFYTSEFKNCIGKYLYYLCSYKIDFDYYKNGSVKPSMTQTDINNIEFYIAPYEIQKEIVSYLDNICNKADKTILCKQQKIEKLQQYKKSLIYEYVTGKRRV